MIDLVSMLVLLLDSSLALYVALILAKRTVHAYRIDALYKPTTKHKQTHDPSLHSIFRNITRLHL
jgi:hypothetical protein